MSLLVKANDLFREKHYYAALMMYKLAGIKYGEDLYKINIDLCNTRLKLGLGSKEKKQAFTIGELRKLFWDSLRAFDYKACSYAYEYLKSYPIKNNPEHDAWLANAKSKIDQVFGQFGEIQARLEQKNEPAYQARPGRLAYILHNSLPYSSGGYATRGHGLAQGLKEQGLDVICITRPGYPFDIPGDHIGQELESYDEIDGIPYYRIFSPLRSDYVGNRYMLAAAEELKKIFIEQKVEKVLAASNHVTAIAAGIAAKDLGLPFFYEVRGFWEITRVSREPEFAEKPQFKAQVASEAIAAINADHVFTLTTPMMEELQARGVNPDKITLLPNSCDPSRFTPRGRDQELARQLGIPGDIPVIGYIGSFVQYEGLENLAQACSILLQRGLDFRLLLVGNENASGSERGPITEEIMRVASEEGLADKLIMPGRIPHEEVEAYYSLIDIAPFPRKPQPVTEMVSPMKPLEASAMEKAILVSSVRALTEMVVDGETGLVFEKGNIVDMADKLQILIQNPELRVRLGKAGRKWVEEQRTWTKTACTASENLKN